MLRRTFFCFVAALLITSMVSAKMYDYFTVPHGEIVNGSTEEVALWWASSGIGISKDRGLPDKVGSAVIIRSARNESEAAQLIVRPTVKLEGFTATAGNLFGPNEAVISADNIDVLKVHYVFIAESSDGWSIKRAVRSNEGTGTEAGFWPDPLPPFKGPIEIKKDENQPLWIRVKIPRDVPAGIYKGEINLTANGYEAAVPLKVEVYDFTLPDEVTCKTAFGFSHKWVFEYQNLSNEEQCRQVLDKYWANFSDHHISPYFPTPMDTFEVTWPDVNENTKPEDLKPAIDWTAWDKAMERALDHYHFNGFCIHEVPGLGKGSFYSRVEPELLGFKEDTPHYKAAFTNYCQALQEHLREKGWLDEAYLYWFDEPTEKDYEFVANGFAKFKKAAPDIQRMLTRQPEPAASTLFDGPNIWCIATHLYKPEYAKERQEKFDEKLWFYVCTNPKYPYASLFIDHPAVELRVWLWQCWKENVEGILVWSSNYWHSPSGYPDSLQNPYEDPMAWRWGYEEKKGERKPWGNGDGKFIYPPQAAACGKSPEPILDGPVDTIRWEMLRDGIEDYEYLVILKNLLAEKKTKISEEIYEKYSELLKVPGEISWNLTEFAQVPEPVELHRDKLAKAIAELSKL